MNEFLKIEWNSNLYLKFEVQNVSMYRLPLHHQVQFLNLFDSVVNSKHLTFRKVDFLKEVKIQNKFFLQNFEIH